MSTERILVTELLCQISAGEITGNIINVAKLLQEKAEMFPNHQDICIAIDEGSIYEFEGYNSDILFSITGKRLETDDEYDKRMIALKKKLEKKNKSVERYQKKKEERERKIFEELKKKFCEI